MKAESDAPVKVCSGCGEVKSTSEFNVRRASSDGLTPKCRICTRAWAKQYRIKNPELLKSQDRARYQRDKPKREALVKRWQERNPEKVREIKRANYERYYQRYYQRYVEAAKLRYEADPERANIYAREWAAAHPDIVRNTKKGWKVRNPDKVRADRAKRRAMEMQAMPPWVDVPAIWAVYDEADRLTRETGIPHEVDHIVPLRGKNVCGLHVSWNLRAVTQQENRSKHNKLIPVLLAA